MKLTIKQTKSILEKLKESGFEVTQPNEDRREYGVEVISEDYFYEKVNEALE